MKHRSDPRAQKAPKPAKGAPQGKQKQNGRTLRPKSGHAALQAPRSATPQKLAPHGGRAPKDSARWVVGIHSCEETLKVRPKKIREIWLRDDYLSSEQLRSIADHAAKYKIPIEKRTAGQLDQIGSGHQGVALAATESAYIKDAVLQADTKQIVVILDGLEDPHNLGSILRTAWLTGVKAIFIPEDRAVGLTPAVNKIASGGAEHVPVEQHTNLASQMQRLKDAGFWIYGLSEKGERSPWQFELPKKVAWVVGNEGSGMRITTERACDELVRIPQVESGSSYNASIALAMALTDTVRQLNLLK